MGGKQKIFNDSKPIKSLKGYNWTIEYNNSLGEIDLSKIKLHLEPEQKNGYTEGEVLAERFKNNGLNANVLDYLLANPRAIPDDWKVDENGKTRYIFFWGTIYRVSVGNLYVRCLCWGNGAWDWGGNWLSDDFDARNPAALLASPLDSDPKLSFDTLNFEKRLKKVEDILAKHNFV